MAILAVLVGFSMIGGAVAIIRLSNVVENNNVSGLPVAVTVSGASVVAGHLPYANGAVITGQSYDMLVSYTTTRALASAAIIVEFTEPGISLTDVAMSWSQTIPLSWQGMTWTQTGDVLHGTLGIAGGQPAGETVNYYATLVYVVSGDFNFKVWVEGSLA